MQGEARLIHGFPMPVSLTQKHVHFHLLSDLQTMLHGTEARISSRELQLRQCEGSWYSRLAETLISKLAILKPLRGLRIRNDLKHVIY